MSNYLLYGIDLGTTNSCIAKFEAETVKVFRNNDQMNVTPSVVRIEKSGRVIVGRRAYATRLENPENVACEFKRWMGQKDKVVFANTGKTMSAEELSAEVLKAVLADARKQTGDRIESAVITVPAAFGQLQCEATARAAALAGLKEAPLLQEPIAAAIAYGMGPDTRDQRWLVFDLGGGTLDIAVVSSKDGRLSVLDHRGNNLLGGKDIDRLIVERLLLPELEEQFSLPTASSNPIEYRKLLQRLQLKAEEVKIDLSSGESAVVSLFDIGADLDGDEIEAEVTITRAALESICMPLLNKCFDLCEEALKGARLAASKLDKILLVGGPTQMPVLRRLLAEKFAVPVDHSQDPMTVVARGAAIYAASLETIHTEQTVEGESDDNVLNIKLAYDPVSADTIACVEGRVECDNEVELKIESAGGHWTSGWFRTEDGLFESDVSLLDGRSCQFLISGRDQRGQIVEVRPSSFVIRHGLTVAAPPLPHSISAEVVNQDGISSLDVLFERNTSLPCQCTKTYAASKTLRPSEPGTCLAIKLWEGEILKTPEANEWVGSLQISNEDIKRVIPEGSEIEVTICINFSRLMTVEAYVPRIDAHFRRQVYVPERDEKEFVVLAQGVAQDVEGYQERLDMLEDLAGDSTDPSLNVSIREMRKAVEDLDMELGAKVETLLHDPDRAKRVVEESKKVRARIDELAVQVQNADGVIDSRTVELKRQTEITSSLVEEFGSVSEKQELTIIRQELEKSLGKNDKRSIERYTEALGELSFRVLARQDWYWIQLYSNLREAGTYKNERVAQQLIQEGDNAVQSKSIEQLKPVIGKLISLIPDDQAEQSREKAIQAGIRRL